MANLVYNIGNGHRAYVTLSLDDGGYYAEVWDRTGRTLHTTPGVTNNAEAALKLAKAWSAANKPMKEGPKSLSSLFRI